MPELPEVETIVRTLRPRLIGDRIVDVSVFWRRSIARPTGAALWQRLCKLDVGGRPGVGRGSVIQKLTRRGKYIIISLSMACHLVIHLRMTGRLILYSSTDRARAARFTRVCFSLASGNALAFEDLRKFGRLYLVDDPDIVVGGLGPEPLESKFTLEVFWDLLQRHRQIKPLLLDQHVLAGLGNIYVDESLWRARIHPLRHASSLCPNEAEGLYVAIRSTLRDAIAFKGTTFRDYRNADGSAGANQYALAVYGRKGQPCPRCGTAIERIIVGSRGTHLCPQCQRQAVTDGTTPNEE